MRFRAFGTTQNWQLNHCVPLRQIVRVKATMKRQAKTEAELLDHATNNLLRALKQDMRKKDSHVDYDKLRKDGYSDRLLTRLAMAT